MAPPKQPEILDRLTALRQHQREGIRSPHKPLLVLLALGRIAETGASKMPWSWAEQRLARLISEFGPPSRTNPAQSAAYPFTHLRSDLVWVLDKDVPMDRVSPLREYDVVGRLNPELERVLISDPGAMYDVARQLVEAEFPPSLTPDVLIEAGLEPDVVLGGATSPFAVARRRSALWPRLVLEAWDRQCAFCGFDGQLVGATVGVDAAHVRWFNFDGPDELDNGIALCALHHKLFDRGVLAIDLTHQIQVSTFYSARTERGRDVYDLHGRHLQPRPGTILPSSSHLQWHKAQVFKGDPLAA